MVASELAGCDRRYVVVRYYRSCSPTEFGVTSEDRSRARQVVSLLEARDTCHTSRERDSSWGAVLWIRRCVEVRVAWCRFIGRLSLQANICSMALGVYIRKRVNSSLRQNLREAAARHRVHRPLR